MATQPTFRSLFLSFEGRIGRADFWYGQIILGALFLIPAAIFHLASARTLDPWSVGWMAWVAIALLVAPLTWCQFAVAGKRWHDRGKSAWWGMVFFVPLIGGFWWTLELGLLQGEPVGNRYGPPPA